MAFFLYEDEEQRLQNRLEDVWKRINALQGVALTREAAFLQGVVRTTSALLDRFFGPYLVSPQSIYVSTVLSFLSILCCETVPYLNRRDTTLLFQHDPIFVFEFLVILALLIVGGISKQKDEDTYGCLLVLIVIACALFSIFLPTHFIQQNLFLMIPSFGLFVLLPSTLIDILFIMFFRWTLKRIMVISGIIRIASIVLGISFVTALLIGPYIVAVLRYTEARTRPIGEITYDAHIQSPVAAIVVTISMTNIVDAVLLLFFL